LTIEKDLKPAVSSYSMHEDRSQKDAALSHSDSGPLRRVRDPGGLESQSLTPRSGSVLKGRTLHMSQISDPQALTESSAVTAQGQAVLSQSGSESAITHAVSAAAADPSQVHTIYSQFAPLSFRPSNQFAPMSTRPTNQLAPPVDQLAPTGPG